MISYPCMRTRLSLFALAAFPLSAQWLKLPTEGFPRTADGKVNMSAPAPRKPDGKPDLSGIWTPRGTKYLVNLAADFKPGELPIQPWAEALTKERSTEAHGAEESDANCLPPGIPKINATPNPFKIVQDTKLVVILYESFGLYRQVFLDGREPRKDANPSWQGYSVGRWESGSFVVDTNGFNDQSVLDAMGHFHSEAMKVTERFRRIDFGHIELQVTVDDPRTYTKAVTIKVPLNLLPDTDLIESFCESENDLAHMPGK